MKNKIKLLILIIGTILFDLLFWKESIGYNALLFSVFILGSTFYLFPNWKKSIPALITAVGILITSIISAYHASELVIFVWIMSLALFPAFIHNNSLKSYVFSLPTSLLSYVMLPEHLQNVNMNKKKSKKLNKVWRFIKITIIPLIVLYIFYWIFKLANPVFDEATDKIFTKFNEWIISVFENFSIWQIVFFIWGFTLISWFIYKGTYKELVETEKRMSDIIKRKRKKKLINVNIKIVQTIKLKLKNEFRSGLILMILINALILIINIIDINWIWFGFEYTEDINLTQFVHEGTYLLILSIFLSMGIMLYFFRRNQNFYSKRKALQITSYVWIFQNAILLISVIIRNLHYIHYFGLAYKRIGLFFFLVLVLFGLITLVIKIKNRKTAFYLLKANTFAMYIGFVLFAVPDWDVIIAKHNLTSKTTINTDTKFLLTLDTKILPFIDQNQEILENTDLNSDTYYFSKTFKEVYKEQRDNFMNEYKEKAWFSRNYTDTKVYEYFVDKE